MGKEARSVSVSVHRRQDHLYRIFKRIGFFFNHCSAIVARLQDTKLTYKSQLFSLYNRNEQVESGIKITQCHLY